MKLAIVGAGPAGLMSARLLERSRRAEVTIFEASDRAGGKLQTRTFAAAPVRYEAGVAECYEYEAFGPDPLKELVRALGLGTRPTHGGAYITGEDIVRDDAELAERLGAASLDAVLAFRRRAASMVSPAAWHHGFGPEHDLHPWARRTFAEILDDEIADPDARRYFAATAHSDLATEPHLASGLVGLRNVLKSVPGYGAQYTLDGGMEMLARRLAGQLTRTEVRLGTRVVRVARVACDRYAVRLRQGGRVSEETFDGIVLALPYNQLYSIEMNGERLRRAIAAHVARYDTPGHYLRVSVLFRRPFWRRLISGSWMMLDRFGGCCVYDESAIHEDASGYGVLGWLIAGTEALVLCNASDRELTARVLESLPRELQPDARRHFVESRVHRWAGGVSGQPGGFVLRDPAGAHQPEPVEHPRLVVAGDYLFDSTLNGVLRSARLAADLLLDGRRADAPPPRRMGSPIVRRRLEERCRLRAEPLAG